MQQFNLNVEHQLPGNVVVTAGYAGSRSSHILVDGLNLNVASPAAAMSTGSAPAAIPAITLGCGYHVAPFRPFATIANNNDVGERDTTPSRSRPKPRASRHGLYALLGYTYVPHLRLGIPGRFGHVPRAQPTGRLPGHEKADWGLSQINLNHQFTASVIYDLPFGKGKHFGSDLERRASMPSSAIGKWMSFERVTSGFPLFVVNSANGSGVNFQWNGNSSEPPRSGDPNRWPVQRPGSSHASHTLQTGSTLRASRQRRPENWGTLRAHRSTGRDS